jgi:hypothetical protein
MGFITQEQNVSNSASKNPVKPRLFRSYLKKLATMLENGDLRQERLNKGVNKK